MTKAQRQVERIYAIAKRLDLAAIDVEALIKCERTLHRWAEQECGDGNDYTSWAIERDEVTGKPFRVVYPHTGQSHRTAIPDREAGALKRVAAICKEHGLYFFHQSDPRGCALYVSREPLTNTAYTKIGRASCRERV